jgi:hypothetical protein
MGAAFRPARPTSGEPPTPTMRRWEGTRPSRFTSLLSSRFVVGVEVLFFRHHFWERLIANVGIVLVFAAFYPRFRHALGG